MKDASVFYRNLEAALDSRRSTHHLIPLRNRGDMVDFLSNDVLSLSSSKVLRQLFMDEIAANPDFSLGSTASRLMPSNTTYIETLEQEIAAYHRADSGLVLGSGYDGNAAIFCAIPRPGDVVLYDELVHASVHDGLKLTLAETQKSFRHNDIDSFEDALMSLKESYPLIRSGSRCVLIAVEAVYSMDGDVCPLKDLVDIAKEIFPNGNAQFIIDEAHSTGMIGEDGRGLVCELGLEKQIAIRLHTFGKALGAMGGELPVMILCLDGFSEPC
jgi:8-amino-7-oxononanoate synthase